MKTLLRVTAVLAVSLMAVGAQAQMSPTVGVFFDQSFAQMAEDCPSGGGIDSAFVVAMNFNTFVSGIEYSINYPTTMTWVSDYGTPPVTIGSTPTGISEGFALPQNGFSPIIVAKILFLWNCAGCVVTDDPIIVSAHPISGFVRATDFPNYDFINAVGMTSLVCATVPTEETSWGRIKSLYGE
jgi:hypothetical protein